MFCVIYRFEVHEGREQDFVRSWSAVTTAFRESCGALGSRLHASSGRDHVAYAQWPSREHWERAQLPPAIEKGAFVEMRASCSAVETLYELSPVADELVLVRAVDD